MLNKCYLFSRINAENAMNVIISSVGSVSNVGKSWSIPLIHICNYSFGEKCLHCALPRAPALWIFLVLPKLGRSSYLWDTPGPAQSSWSLPALLETSWVHLSAFGFSQHSGDFVLSRQLLFSCTFLHSIFHSGQVNISSNTLQAWSTPSPSPGLWKWGSQL